MAARDDDAHAGERADARLGAVQLRRERHLLHGRKRVEAAHEVRVRRAQERRVLGPRHLGVEERPLKVDAEARRARAARLVAFRAAAERRQVRLGAREPRREEARHAVLQAVAAHRVERRVRQVAEVAAGASVRVDVDEAGQREEAVRRDDLLAGRRREAGADVHDAVPGDADRRAAEVAPGRHGVSVLNEHVLLRTFPAGARMPRRPSSIPKRPAAPQLQFLQNPCRIRKAAAWARRSRRRDGSPSIRAQQAGRRAATSRRRSPASASAA